MSDYRVLALRHRRGGASEGDAPEPSVEVSRFYFCITNEPDITPAYDAGWNDTGSAVRRNLVSAKIVESQVFGGPSAVNGNGLCVQFVSAALVSQAIAGTVKCYARAFDFDEAGDITSRLSIKVVSSDGASVRGTLLALGDHSTGSLFNFPARNKAFADGDALSGVSAQSGDRLVVEMGGNCTQGLAVRIERGAPEGTDDLPEDETTTDQLVGWIEFSNPILVAA